MEYTGPERRASTVILTDEQINEIAERAAARALERVYAQIGRSIVHKILFWAGAAVLAVVAYLKGTGKW